MHLSVFGLGYVGAVSCGCLSKIGHHITGVDVSDEKVEKVKAGVPPVQELGLEELFSEAIHAGTLTATEDSRGAVATTDAALICVGTPSTDSGGVNDKYLMTVIEQIGQASADREYVVINRSTCPPNVHRKLEALLGEKNPNAHYVCHPEFLREGVAVADFFAPPKIVFGLSADNARQCCEKLYPGIEASTYWLPIDVSALVKYADNCFHAVKVAFANEIGTIAKNFGTDAREVMEVFCEDKKLNISPKYLRPGAPFGGSCLPKDLRAMLDTGRELAFDLPLLRGVLGSNDLQVERTSQRLLKLSPELRIGIIGLSFKENTDDLRESPYVRVVEALLGKGREISIFDQTLSVAKLTGSNLEYIRRAVPHLERFLVGSLGELVSKSEVLVVNHRLNDTDWKRLTIPSSTEVLDNAGVKNLQTLPNYNGLHWS